MRRLAILLAFVLALAMPGVRASTLTIPNLNFQPNTTIQSSQMNANFNAIQTWANSNGAVQQVTGTLSSTDLLNIHTSPKVVIPAPGAGYYIQVIGAAFHFTYNGVVYSASQPLLLEYVGAASASQFFSAVNLQTAASQWAIISGLAFAATASGIDNTAIQITSAANPTLGTGTCTYTISYIVVAD